MCVAVGASEDQAFCAAISLFLCSIIASNGALRLSFC